MCTLYIFFIILFWNVMNHSQLTHVERQTKFMLGQDQCFSTYLQHIRRNICVGSVLCQNMLPYTLPGFVAYCECKYSNLFEKSCTIQCGCMKKLLINMSIILQSCYTTSVITLPCLHVTLYICPSCSL